MHFGSSRRVFSSPGRFSLPARNFESQTLLQCKCALLLCFAVDVTTANDPLGEQMPSCALRFLAGGCLPEHSQVPVSTTGGFTTAIHGRSGRYLQLQLSPCPISASVVGADARARPRVTCSAVAMDASCVGHAHRSTPPLQLQINKTRATWSLHEKSSSSSSSS